MKSEKANLCSYFNDPGQASPHKVSHLVKIQLVYRIRNRVAIREYHEVNTV
jgi:hypothetical protein